MSSNRRLSSVKRVCIIGGGPAGVAAAKAVRAEKHFSRIDIFEQRSTVGGVWNYEPENDTKGDFSVPHLTPDVPLEKPRWRGHEPHRRATYQSPMYERLEANLPKMLMQHSDLNFPIETQLFPTHEEILNYLEEYAYDIKDSIMFETQVIKVSLTCPKPPTWKVLTENLRTRDRFTNTYDAVIVASGHYQIPFIPPYEGIESFNAQHPHIIKHSKNYNSPEGYRDKTVLIIGYGPSGSDIASQIASTCKQPLHVSTRSGPPALLPPNSVHHPAIASFSSDLNLRNVHFIDSSSLQDVGAILFCTGYLYSYPFLSPDLRAVLDPPPTAPATGHKGSRLHGTYQQIFFTPQPTLSFLTLPWNIVPFPVAESQAAAIARVYSGRLALPSKEDCWAWERQREAKDGVGAGKGFHRLAPPSDVDYINELSRWCASAEAEDQIVNDDDDTAPRNSHMGAAHVNGSAVVGKVPPYWDDRMRWLRLNVPDIKKSFAEKGEERHAIRTLKELGFRYPGKHSD